MRNRPCWKAVNAQIRKNQAEKKAHKAETDEAYKQGLEDRRLFNERMGYTQTFKGQYALTSEWDLKLPFEVRMKAAKEAIARQFAKKLEKEMSFEHVRENLGTYTETWYGRITIVKEK